MVTNKNMTESENAVIDLKNATKDYKAAAVYAVYGDNEQIRLLDIVKDVKDNKVNVELPAFSAAMVVVSDDASAFDGLKKADEIKTETKTETFDDIKSMINKNGYVEVPITDAKHISKIVINGKVTSSAGSSWATAGCAVCINAKDKDGKDFWTYKDYSLPLGDKSTATVKFDGTLTKSTGEGADKVSEDIEAYIADGKVELQKWWDASEKGENEGDDTIDVEYTSIQVVYEYTDEDVPADTTTTTTAKTTASTTTTTVTTAASTTTSSETKKPEDVVYGDANLDKDVTLADAVLIMQSIANPDKFGIKGTDEHHITEKGQLNADCSNVGDGVTNTDALAIQKFKLNIIKELPEKK